MEKMCKERSFSIELKSKVNLKNVTLTNGGQENVLIEGAIGKLQRAEFVEDVILEIVGDKGVLRVDLAENEIKKQVERSISEQLEKQGEVENQ